MTKPKIVKPERKPWTWKQAVEAMVVAAKAYEAYEKLEPLLSAVFEGVKIGIENILRLARTDEPVVEFERQVIALGIVAQVLRELRTAQLPSADYDADDMFQSICHAVKQMIEDEKYTSLVPKIEIVALKQKLEAALPSNAASKPIRPLGI